MTFKVENLQPRTDQDFRAKTDARHHRGRVSWYLLPFFIIPLNVFNSGSMGGTGSGFLTRVRSRNKEFKKIILCENTGRLRIMGWFYVFSCHVFYEK